MRLMAFVAGLLMLAAPLWADVDIQDIESPGGVKAWLVEDHSIPFVALEIRFRGGASLDEPGKRGATNLMVALLEEGAGDLDARGFAKRQEELAASFGFDVGDDTVSVSAKFLNENRDQALALLHTALVAPRFDEDAIERVRSQVISVIRSDMKDPNTIASRAFDAAVFGDDPYGSSLEGTEASVAALTRDDIVTAYRNALARDRIYVGAAGAITADELSALVDRLFDGLPAKGKPILPKVPVETTAGVTVVPFETPQSVAVFGHVGLERNDPDFFPAYVLNEILGGSGLEARLMKEVRETRGLTYGVYSYLVPKDRAALYLGQVASANDRIAAAIDVIREQWRLTAENGVTAEELKNAKTYLTGAYPLRFDGNGRIANILVGMQMDHLPLDYVKTRNAKIEAITLEDIKRVAARILKPDQLRFVVVGQPEGLPRASQ